jgi:hypothetical protein
MLLDAKEAISVASSLAAVRGRALTQELNELCAGTRDGITLIGVYELLAAGRISQDAAEARLRNEVRDLGRTMAETQARLEAIGAFKQLIEQFAQKGPE